MIRKQFILALTFSLVIPGLSMTWSPDEYGILNEEDYSIVARPVTPTLQTPLGEEPYLQSFNEWRCFSQTEVEIDCYEEKSGVTAQKIDPEERDGKGYYPTMIAEKDGHTFIFEAPGWVHLDSCQKNTAKWKNLIDGQAGFCVLAASWPPNIQEFTEGEASHWMIYGLKTTKGRDLAPIYDPNLHGEDEELETIE